MKILQLLYHRQYALKENSKEVTGYKQDEDVVKHGITIHSKDSLLTTKAHIYCVYGEQVLLCCHTVLI